VDNVHECKCITSSNLAFREKRVLFGGWGTGKMWIEVKIMAMNGIMDLFEKFVYRPEASPKQFNICLMEVSSSIFGYAKITTASAYKEMVKLFCTTKYSDLPVLPLHHPGS
jgi:hypothetical protein